MNLKVYIDKTVIESYIEDSYTSDHIFNKTTSNNTVSVNRMFKGFINKAVEYLVNFTKPAGNLQIITPSTGEDDIQYVNIKNTKETMVFFETFKRLGINIGVLTIGFDKNFTKIYLSDKIIKDLKRYDGSPTLTAIVMYIMSLGFFYSQLCTVAEKYVVDSYTRQISIENDFAELFYSFNNDHYNIELKGISSEDYTKITWISSPYSIYEYTPNCGESLVYNFINIDNSTPALMLKYELGTRPVYFQIFENGEVATNLDLNYFELQGDSIIRLVMPRIELISTIYHTTHFAGKEWYTIEVDEASDKLKAMLAEIMTRTGVTEGLTKEDAANLGIALKGTGVAIDADSIKEQYKDDSYAEQLYKQVLPYYDTFDLGNLTNLIPGFAKGDIYAMLFTGDSGAGKSTSARVIPYKCGLPYISVNFSINIEEADLFGSMIPNPTKKDASDPEFIWQDGIITKAVRNGYCAILEEINFARPGVLGKFNSLLDENRQIDLSTGEIVKAHKNFRMIATCNIAYEGTNRMNKAFVNRFEQIINFQVPDLATLTEIIKLRTGYTDATKLANILDAYSAIRKYSEEQNLNAIISVRQLLTIFKQGKYYKTAAEAVENIMINTAFIDVPEHAEVFKKSILPALNLKFKI